MYEKCFNLDKKGTAKIFEKLQYKNRVVESKEQQKKLSEIFKEIMKSRSYENISALKRLVLCEYSDFYEQRSAIETIKFLIEVCGVDPNSIDFSIFSSDRQKDGNIVITAAAQAYRFKNFDIGSYLYSLYDSKTINNEKRENSDMVIMNEICENNAPYFLINFIKEKNFQYTSKNFICIMNILMHKQLTKRYINETEKKQIIALFLERAEKEELEKIKLLVEQFLNFTDRKVIKASRQAVVARLRKELDVLLAEAPGKMSVGDAHTKRLRHPLEGHEW